MMVFPSNYRAYWDNYGAIIVGIQSRYRLYEGGRMSYELIKELSQGIYLGEMAVNCRERYGAFVQKLLYHYPQTHIVITTTLMENYQGWEQ